MSKPRPYHIPHRGATVATYWLLQWVAIVVLIAAFMAIVGQWSMGPPDLFPWILAGTVWTAVIMTAQAAYATTPDAIGGRREIGKFRSAISLTIATLGATGLCALVMWLVLGLCLAAASGRGLGEAFVLGALGTLTLLIFWAISIREFVRKGRREEQYAKLTMRMLAGSGLCAIVCATISVLVGLFTSDWEATAAIAALCAPWLVGAAIALLGCLLYLKRLWTFRAPWYETHCAECGYDLSGNLAVTHCSECGTPWTRASIMPAGSRRAAGHCEGCNYDMSGTPDAEKCPECGDEWRSAPVAMPPGGGA